MWSSDDDLGGSIGTDRDIFVTLPPPPVPLASPPAAIILVGLFGAMLCRSIRRCLGATLGS